MADEIWKKINDNLYKLEIEDWIFRVEWSTLNNNRLYNLQLYQERKPQTASGITIKVDEYLNIKEYSPSYNGAISHIKEGISFFAIRGFPMDKEKELTEILNKIS